MPDREGKRFPDHRSDVLKESLPPDTQIFCVPRKDGRSFLGTQKI